jgi:MFS transporter, ACS family, hexuronate transporter
MRKTIYYRWLVLAPLLLAIAGTNFGDRVVMGVVVPLLVKQFGFTPQQLGWILSAFGFGFCAMQCLGSATIVRWQQPRRVIAGMGALWAIFIGLVAAAGSGVSFFILRALFGLSEGCNWAAFLTLASRWYPSNEIKRAVNFFWFSVPFTAVVIPPFAALLAHSFSWRAPFLVLGAVGVILAALFFVMVRDFPEESPHVTQEERQAIVSTRVLVEQHVQHRYKWRTVLTSPSGWWLAVGSVATAYQGYMLIAWLPEYLVRDRHMSFIHSGIFAALPFLAGGAGCLLLAAAADAATHRGRPFLGRTVVPGAGVVLAGLAFLLIPYVGSTTLVLCLIATASFFGQAANGLLAAAVIEVYPHEPHMGTQFVVGAGSLTAIFAPLVTGYVLAATGNFLVAFVIGGCPAVLVGIAFLGFFRSEPVTPDWVADGQTASMSPVARFSSASS